MPHVAPGCPIILWKPKRSVVKDLPFDVTLDSSPEEGLKEKRMIGDFDGSANSLWTLYGKEAKSYDEARIQTLKEDMDGVLIFVRLYLAHTYRHDHPDS